MVEVKPVSEHIWLTNYYQRVLISRKNLLRAFEPNRDLFESVPAKMEEEMLNKQPLHHLLSVYMIKPISFDQNPFVLPKAA